MYKVKDVMDVIEGFAPLPLQEEWDNSGLSVGSEDAPVSSVLLALDCTPDLVDEAVAIGADMIVTHHPLIFRGLKRITPDTPTGKTVMKAVKAGVAVYSAHTNADKVLAGVSGAMAARLGLEDVRVLDSDNNGNGLGAVGSLAAPMSSCDFIKFVKDRFGLVSVRTSRPADVAIRKVAVCGGAGSSLIGKAAESGADVFVTGDVSYHNFFTDDNFMIMDIGHHESEKDIVGILFSLIKKNFPTFAVHITENVNSNPIYYF